LQEAKTQEQLLLEIESLKARIAEIETFYQMDEDGYASMVRALRLSEEKFSNAFHYSTDIMTISSLQDARYVDVNDAFLNIVGFPREEVVGHTSYEIDIWQYRLTVKGLCSN
jgi:PAS domain-containing protein